MAIATSVQRRVAFEGPGCRHALLMVVTRPSYPNHDARAEDAAYAFQESAFAHLRAWFEAWRLPSLCPAQHDPRQGEDVEDPESQAEVEGPGFRWLDLDGEPTYLLTESAEDADLRE